MPHAPCTRQGKQAPHAASRSLLWCCPSNILVSVGARSFACQRDRALRLVGSAVGAARLLGSLVLGLALGAVLCGDGGAEALDVVLRAFDENVTIGDCGESGAEVGNVLS